ncbi:MAG TPA: DUF885 family protein, partial [Candidatus Acidoferrum sp.]|nr:DUF885 family protein [Candidatus Acidoferrum sp.]
MLATLAAEFWEGLAEAHPLEATYRGDRRFDDRMDDITPEATERERLRLLDIATRAEAIPEADLRPADRVTRGALIAEAAGGAAVNALDLEAWTVDPLEGWHIQLQNISSYQPVSVPDQAGAMVRRWRTFAPQLDQVVANLRRGAADGRVAVRTPVAKVVDAIGGTLEVADDDSPFLAALREPHEDWSQEHRSRFSNHLTATLHEQILPALTRYRTFLADEILPRARPDETPGLLALPGGVAAYRTLVRYHTTLDLEPEAVHETGLSEVARINAEMGALGRLV